MKPTVPRKTLVTIVESYGNLATLYKQQQATQAEMIRACVHKLRTTPEEAARRAEHRREQANALLYLEWLATSLEDQSVR